MKVRTRFADHRQIQAVIPVPMHPKKLRERGFNQAETLAHALTKHLKLPLINTGVKRIHLDQQVGRSAQKRSRIVSGSFVTNSKYLKGLEHVLLVDDVYTTGSTLNALSNALHCAGISRIDRYSLARTILRK